MSKTKTILEFLTDLSKVDIEDNFDEIFEQKFCELVEKGEIKLDD